MNPAIAKLATSGPKQLGGSQGLPRPLVDRLLDLFRLKGGQTNVRGCRVPPNLRRRDYH